MSASPGQRRAWPGETDHNLQRTHQMNIHHQTARNHRLQRATRSSTKQPSLLFRSATSFSSSVNVSSLPEISLGHQEFFLFTQCDLAQTLNCSVIRQLQIKNPLVQLFLTHLVLEPFLSVHLVLGYANFPCQPSISSDGLSMSLCNRLDSFCTTKGICILQPCRSHEPMRGQSQQDHSLRLFKKVPTRLSNGSRVSNHWNIPQENHINRRL